jgi:hypothetical protein
VTPKEPHVRLILELTTTPDQISGKVSRPGQPAVTFAGWIGLLLALDTLRHPDPTTGLSNDPEHHRAQ